MTRGKVERKRAWARAKAEAVARRRPAQRATGQLRLPDVPARPPANAPGHGGRRAGAGRKPGPGRPRIPHRTRPPQSDRVPLHVTIRIHPGLPRLRRRLAYRLVQRAIALANRFGDGRICHASIQGNHLHLLVEVDRKRALTRLMKSFSISFSKNVNHQLAARGGVRRKGPVLADRFHQVKLTTPAQVRAALGYVLSNWRRHGEDKRGPRQAFDGFSTAVQFPGWVGAARPLVWFRELLFPDVGFLPVAHPRSWLLREGWKVHGKLSPWARPGPLTERERRERREQARAMA